MRALAILTVLPLVLTTPALAQNAQSIQQQPTSPNSGAGIPGQPGWQKRTRREAFDCDDWFGCEIRRGPQSGCGQGCRIAGKQRAVQQSSHPPTQPRA